MNGINTSGHDPTSGTVDEFAEFLSEYYHEDILEAARDNHDTISVSWPDMFQYDMDLAEDFVDYPREMLEALRRALWGYDIPVPGAEDNVQDMDVRVGNVDAVETNVSGLRTDAHKGAYLGLKGQVGLASQVTPILMKAMFRCERCSDRNHDFEVGPFIQRGEEITTPDQCPGCERPGPFTIIDDKSTHIDHQLVELADPPGEDPGSASDTVTIEVYGDLAGRVNPGDRIRANGIAESEYVELQANDTVARRQDWELTAHDIDAEQKAFAEVEPERVDEIQRIAAEENVRQWFVDSFAPDILTGDRGDTHKLAVILSMFGGSGDGGRSDINIFFIGAPGTGKSHYLERANELAPKSVMASGKGATAAGLTATATRHEKTGKWMLDAGALVLASGGLACIDEFDKMDSSARKSMHEAMENQRVPINKAGINTTLTTETAVIAAANPKHGSFERVTPVNEQVELGSPLLSRFDLIFGIYDTVDPDRDEDIARHQQARARDTDEGTAVPMDDELITEYVAYARQNVSPTFDGPNSDAEELLVNYYVETRNESDGDGVMPVTPRMNDALRRLAQASARMHLRDTITVDDAELAISMMNMTIGDTAVNEKGQVDFGRKEGRNITQRDRKDLIKDVIQETNGNDPVAEDTIESVMMNTHGVPPGKTEDELEALLTRGELYEPKTDHYLTT